MEDGKNLYLGSPKAVNHAVGADNRLAQVRALKFWDDPPGFRKGRQVIHTSEKPLYEEAA